MQKRKLWFDLDSDFIPILVSLVIALSLVEEITSQEEPNLVLLVVTILLWLAVLALILQKKLRQVSSFGALEKTGRVFFLDGKVYHYDGQEKLQGVMHHKFIAAQGGTPLKELSVPEGELERFFYFV